MTENFHHFYPFLPSDQNPPELLNRTTLHWQSIISTDDEGEANISFYTNQLKGAVGVSATGVFSAETTFVVK